MKRSIWIMAAVLVFYITAYFGLVKAVPVVFHPPVMHYFPKYRIGGRTSHQIFYPMQKLDQRRLRPTYWQGRELSDEELLERLSNGELPGDGPDYPLEPWLF